LLKIARARADLLLTGASATIAAVVGAHAEFAFALGSEQAFTISADVAAELWTKAIGAGTASLA
jgi:hypothetical protein